LATEIIEKSCLAIMKELKQGKFTRQELEFLERFFQAIVDTTKQKLSSQHTDTADTKRRAADLRPL